MAVQFGPFHLDAENACIWRGSEALHLTPKAFAVLRALLARPGRLVTKDELWQSVWPGIAVSDAALEDRLRTGTPAVMGRLRDGKLVLDVRTVFAEQEDALVEALRQAVADSEKAGEADGHGFFSRALIEGLEGKGPRNSHNGIVYLHHLEQYVIDRVQELSKDQQHPVSIKPAMPPLPLAKP